MEEYVRGDQESEATEVEIQTLQVTWQNAIGGGALSTKLLTVTDVEYGDDLVAFWNNGKLLLMVKTTLLREAFDTDEILSDGE